MTITTEEAERLADRVEDEGGLSITATALRSLAAERAALQAEKARLQEAIEMARDCIDDKDVIGARQTLAMALGETQ
jgi:hypothetical protein